MKFFKWAKDGGPESTVSGLFIIEIKNWFSIVLLRFAHGSREAYHSHAFNAKSWLLKGFLMEFHYAKENELDIVNTHYPRLKPIVTLRDTFHKVYSIGTSWVISFRGPWSKTWRENVDGEYRTLTHGRQEV
jgi:hypothetical protein